MQSYSLYALRVSSMFSHIQEERMAAAGIEITTTVAVLEVITIIVVVILHICILAEFVRTQAVDLIQVIHLAKYEKAMNRKAKQPPVDIAKDIKMVMTLAMTSGMTEGMTAVTQMGMSKAITITKTKC